MAGQPTERIPPAAIRAMAGALAAAAALVFAFAGPATAATARLETQRLETFLPLLPGAELLEDPESRATIEDWAGGEAGDWQPNDLGLKIRWPSAGQLFARTRIDFAPEPREPLYLTLGSPFLQDIRVALVQGGRVVWDVEASALRPFDERPLPDRRPILELPRDIVGEATLYVQVRHDRLVFLYARLWSQRALIESKGAVDYFLGGCFGLSAALALYNLIIFLSTRQRSYLYYTGFLVFSGVWVMAKNGYAYQYLWPESPLWNQNAQLVASGLARVCAGLFAGSLLELRTRAPGFHRLNLSFVIASAASATIAGLGAWQVAFGMELVLGFTHFPVMLLLGSVVWWRGARFARYFVVGWLALAGLLVAMQLSAMGVLPWTPLATWGIEIGSGLEAILFSLALAARINDLHADLRASNTELSEYRDHLERRVAERTDEMITLQRKLVGIARASGMSEVATGVLHNVGNALNSVGVSTAELRTRLEASRAARLRLCVEMLTDHRAELARYLVEDEEGRIALDYLDAASQEILHEHEALAEEVERLTRSTGHVADILAAQQRHTTPPPVRDLHDVVQLVEDAIGIAGARQGWRDAELSVTVPEDLTIEVDPHRVVQILVNLLLNARQATDRVSGRGSRMGVDAYRVGEDQLAIEVRDNGVGIAPQDLERIFQFGFTTRPDGSGFGLHASANLAAEMGGRLEARSNGPGRGATFRLLLPLARGSAKPGSG